MRMQPVELSRVLRAAASWSLCGLVAFAVALPWLLQANSEGLPALWWASRSFGFVSYVALWLAMLTGVLIGAKGIEGWLDRRTLLELHQQWTLAGVIVTALHVLAVVMNQHAGVGVAGALIPFTSDRLRVEVGVGVVAFWGAATVAVTTWLRARLRYPVWRAVHAMAFGAFLLALIHSVSSGTDSGLAAVRWMYVGSGSLLLGAIVTRVLLAVLRPTREHAHESSALESV